MTIKDFYTKIDGNYEDVLLRLPNDEFIQRFLNRFLDDKTFADLEKAIKEDDIKQAFEYSHKLKGIVANLSFSAFYQAVYDLCEQLRPLNACADKELFDKVNACYYETIDAIKMLD